MLLFAGFGRDWFKFAANKKKSQATTAIFFSKNKQKLTRIQDNIWIWKSMTPPPFLSTFICYYLCWVTHKKTERPLFATKFLKWIGKLDIQKKIIFCLYFNEDWDFVNLPSIWLDIYRSKELHWDKIYCCVEVSIHIFWQNFNFS